MSKGLYFGLGLSSAVVAAGLAVGLYEAYNALMKIQLLKHEDTAGRVQIILSLVFTAIAIVTGLMVFHRFSWKLHPVSLLMVSSAIVSNAMLTMLLITKTSLVGYHPYSVGNAAALMLDGPNGMFWRQSQESVGAFVSGQNIATLLYLALPWTSPLNKVVKSVIGVGALGLGAINGQLTVVSAPLVIKNLAGYF